MRRKMSRQKRTGFLIAGVGLATGVTALILWPRIKKLFTTPTVTGMIPGTKIGNKIWDGRKWVREDEYIDPDFVDSLPIDPRFDFKG